jgi:hypothetical protein
LESKTFDISKEKELTMNKKFWISLVLALLVAFTSTLGSALAASGPLGDLFLITGKPEDEIHPAVAYNSNPNRGGEYMVVFYNDLSGNDNIRAVRLSRDGKRILGDTWVSVGLGAERRFPDITFNPDEQEYLVVWEHFIPRLGTTAKQYSIRAQRLDQDGNLKGGEIIIANPASRGVCGKPAVAYASTSKKYLVVWENQDIQQPTKSIKAQVMPGKGPIGSKNFVLAQGNIVFSHTSPDLAYNRGCNCYLVAWERWNGDSKDFDVYGRLVKGDGSVSIDTYKIFHGPFRETNPSVGAIPNLDENGQFMVVAEFHWTFNNDKDIVSRRMNGKGTLLGERFVSYDPLHDATNPAVAGSEVTKEYLVTWTMPNPYNPQAPLVHAQAYSTTGVPLCDFLPLVPGHSPYSAVASGPFGEFLVAMVVSGRSWEILGRIWGP